ncbi:protein CHLORORESPIRATORY REDUCTION 41, chloroplastic [Alnus glutinosa]|jgi:hypothetical protein|uniref:protein CHLORORESPIRATORY REDUCTION 41, chloroplastic n=1 Tax=Alnus glutinosa TaxID=3517 RepID=UPI002D79C1E0|nr:protein CHLORORESPIRATORY REDUCTION 41, chloroplastic [Alnus glutinosa]
MASTLLQFLLHPNPLHLNPSQALIHSPHRKHSSIKCSTSNSTPQPDLPYPTPDSDHTLNKPESFPIEKRRKSEITRDRKSTTGLVKPEPRNFEIGWKRTKEIKLEKPKGYVIADFLEKLEGLMGKEFGSTELLVKAGEIVAERAREEAEVLRDEGQVEDRMITELFRVLRLMEMDLAMVKAAAKEETLGVRLEQAKARCRQAILVALSF